MAINFGAEYKRFEKKWQRSMRLYAQLGMSQEQIDALDEFDKEEFLSDNTYKRHVQSLSIDEDSGNPEDLHPLFKKFGDVLSVELKVTLSGQIRMAGRDIFPPELIGKLLSLAPEDLELLDAYVFGEKTQVELAKTNGISQKNISKSSIA